MGCISNIPLKNGFHIFFWANRNFWSIKLWRWQGKSWIADEMQVMILSKNWLSDFFKWIHLSFTGPILQHYQRQIEDTGGKIVQPDKASVIFSSWLKCDPMYTTWTSNLLKFSAFSRIALQNIFRNISYWNSLGKNPPQNQFVLYKINILLMSRWGINMGWRYLSKHVMEHQCHPHLDFLRTWKIIIGDNQNPI